MKIGQLLKEARSRSGLSQEDVADKVGVSRQSISNWENSRTYPDIVSIIKLSDLYGLSLDEMLKGDEDIMKHFHEEGSLLKSYKKLIALFIAMIALMLVILLVNILGIEGKIIFRILISATIVLSWLVAMEIIERI